MKDNQPNGFEYQLAGEDRVFLFHHGRRVTTLAGREAVRFLARVEAADELAAQHLMARATGHYKHGNER